jgi:hypothetical protein
VEFEEDRPRGRINTGRRAWGEDDPRDVLDTPSEHRPAEREREGRSGSRYAPRHSAPKDPFFDKPYEPGEAKEEKPSWEVSARPTARAISSNIKPKRKVAALFKTQEPA